MNTVDIARAEIAALDFSAENARIAAIEAEIIRVQAAIEKAEARCTELVHAKMGLREQDIDAIADAMIGNVGPSDAVSVIPSADAIEGERKALRAAIKNLHRRIAEEREQIANIRREASSKAMGAIRPLVDTLLDQARQAGETLVETYAAVSAIDWAFGGNLHRETSAIGEGVKSLACYDGLIPHRRNADAPIDVLSVIEGARGKGRALPVRYVATIEMP